MKIRTPSAAQSAQLEALGAIPIDMPANQIYNNLDRGVIDASMIPMSAALDFKLIEVAKYFTIDAPLGRSPFLVAMNQSALREAAGRPEEGHRRHHRPQAQPQGRGDLRQEEQRGDRGGEEGPRDHHAVGGRSASAGSAAFKPMIRQQVAAGEKAGLPARGLVDAYGLLS